MKLRVHVLVRVFPLVLTLVGAGCMAVPEGKLSPLRYDEVLGQELMPAISYSLRGQVAQTEMRDIALGTRSASPQTDCDARIEEVFRRAFVQARPICLVGPTPEQPDEVHLDIYFRRSQRHIGVTIGTALLFICTAGIFPAYGYDELYLDVRVLKNGQLGKQYVYEDGVATWYEWFLFPFSFTHDPTDISLRTTENMLLHLLVDLRRDLPALLADEPR